MSRKKINIGNIDTLFRDSDSESESESSQAARIDPKVALNDGFDELLSTYSTQAVKIKQKSELDDGLDDFLLNYSTQPAKGALDDGCDDLLNKSYDLKNARKFPRICFI